ncbi:TIGR00730 family Rossman fold protein [Ruficoccus amylovorans]|uniref:Cytokinin riboside 5'-monophosphate phosphoribohydrolase n=1 Tax=Ruficoccus amylovorans TaxID=1804625 RepID=A0A842HB21_9BACT|nr:TIGR00730 family Rossman fold protein [Ruficoccus amylovorans]MBC2593329.1 TIGR00730 family Rossman fold protein [Ruficoccus amylovorans]
MANICVFCGANAGVAPVFLDAARQLGRLIAQGGHTLVYGGGRTGLMGAAADAALEASGHVIGVIPHMLAEKEIAHHGLTELHLVDTMHERKMTMATLSDGFAVLPGGIGTLEEFSEVFTWAQLGIQLKPCAVLDVDGYYTPLLRFFEAMVEGGFLLREQLEQLIVESRPEPLLERLLSTKPEVFMKWVDTDAEMC